jgi:dTDP-glucose 4,6-dehydratase
MRLLVTGGFGFIGSAFIRLAVARGHEVVVIDKMTYAADLENIPESIRSTILVSNLDLANKTELKTFLASQEEFEFIVNFAAESHVDRSIEDGIPFVRSNILSVVNLLEHIKIFPQTKFFQVSTDEVYGTIQSGSWDESYPLNPRSAYSSSKASAEMFCNAYRSTHDLQIWITRCANNFGPRQSAEKLIPTVIRSILHNQKVPVYGNGLNCREWIYVEDHALAILRIIESQNPRSKVYNLGGVELANIDLVSGILRIMGSDDSRVSFVEDRKGHDFRYSVNDSLYSNEFGELGQSSFQSQLESTVSWYLDNQNWLERSHTRLEK